MNTLLKEYAKEIYGNENDDISLELLISSHRHLRKLNKENLEDYDKIRKDVFDKAILDSETWLKDGEYIHRDKLAKMTIQEIANFIG